MLARRRGTVVPLRYAPAPYSWITRDRQRGDDSARVPIGMWRRVPTALTLRAQFVSSPSIAPTPCPTAAPPAGVWRWRQQAPMLDGGRGAEGPPRPVRPRGLDGLWGMYQWLDRAPRGRNETRAPDAPLNWYRRHDEYHSQ